MKLTRFLHARRTCVLFGSAKTDGGQSHSIKDEVDEQIKQEAAAFAKVAPYPHRSLTRPVLSIPQDQICSSVFTSNLANLMRIATELKCISFSAPKIHWDASVLVIRGNLDETDFDVWVNPEVPGYNDRNSVAPMYGMWENCISCGLSHAWVVRPQRITCKGYDMVGNEKEEVLDGMRARCLMHELDHLNGKTIIHQAMGPEFVVSGSALGQRDLWPPNFPSAEAYVTPMHVFFDYVTNTTVIPKGLEWWFMQQSRSQQFGNERLTQ